VRADNDSLLYAAAEAPDAAGCEVGASLTYYLLLTTHYLLLTPYYLLLTTYYLLLTRWSRAAGWRLCCTCPARPRRRSATSPCAT
jgi:hypothetical protein